MSLLDRLFSKEIQRRTGAHAIHIYIEDEKNARKRSRSLGSIALNEASKHTRITTKQEKISFLRRLDIRFPWLKLAAVLVIGIIAILNLCDVTVPRANDPFDKIKIAPMAHHVRVTERILTGKKLVALTFDDGPSNLTTPRLLDVLHEKDVHATFFMLGYMARANTDIVKRAKKEGHIIASHTMYHKNLPTLSYDGIKNEVNEANSILKNATGQNPALIRPPYGNINDNVRKIANTPLILWSVDTRDWESKNPQSIVSVAMSQVHDGAIILMHDIYSTSVDAIPNLVDTLRKNGYEFVTVPELAKIRGVNLTKGNIYYNFRP